MATRPRVPARPAQADPAPADQASASANGNGKRAYRADGAKITRVDPSPAPKPPKIRGVYYGKPRCPYCASTALKVIKTDPNARTPKRVYECQSCQHFRLGENTRFTVAEIVTGT